MPNASGGYQPDTKSPSARRADFDLLRRNTALQRQAEGLQAELDAAEARLLATEARLTALETPVPWIVLPLINGWTPYESGLSTSRTPMYRKVGDRVELRGLVKKGTITTFATLPLGYRTPYLNQAFICHGQNNVVVGATASSTGNFDVSGGFPMPDWMWLDPISYSVTP